MALSNFIKDRRGFQRASDGSAALCLCCVQTLSATAQEQTPALCCCVTERASEGVRESVACSRQVNTADAINWDCLGEALMGNQSPSSQELWVTQVVVYSPPDVRSYLEREDRVEEFGMTWILTLTLFRAFSWIAWSSWEFAQLSWRWHKKLVILEWGLFLHAYMNTFY